MFCENFIDIDPPKLESGVEIDAALRTVLRPYQIDILDFIFQRKRCNIFAAMGSGKTLSVLTALDLLSLTEDVFPALVIAPLRVANSTWKDEVQKFAHLNHLKIVTMTGTTVQKTSGFNKKADIYCINLESIEWLEKTIGDRPWPYKTVVVDECTKLKGFRTRQGTKRAKALARHAHAIERYIGLTGTPAPNGIQDLWALMYFIDRGERLGKSFTAFIDRFFRKMQTGPDPYMFTLVPAPGAAEQIQALCKEVCITVDVKAYFDIRSPIVTTVYVDLPKPAREHYRKMERDMFTEIAGLPVEATQAAAKTIKCLQIANGAVYTDDEGSFEAVHSAKLEALDSIVEEANGAPILVAYQFKCDLQRLHSYFPQGRLLDHNPQTIKDWNAGKIPILFAHPQSAGHGLNLQDGGNILAFFGLWWTLEERLQIIERIGPTRQAQSGYDRPVFIYNIIAKDTVDELVMERIETKKSVQQLVLEAMKREIEEAA